MNDNVSTTGVIRCDDKVSSGINLGGIGTGGVEIWADGRLYFWNMFNCRPWATMHAKELPKGRSRGTHHAIDPLEPAVGDTDFFLRVAKPGRRPVYRWLFVGHGLAQMTASHFWRGLRYFFMKSMDGIEYQAQYPFAHLRYVDDELPVEVTLRAWTPFVPHDVKNSALPLAYFDFDVANRTDEPVDVSLVWQMSNRSGYAAGKCTQAHALVGSGRNRIVHMEGSLAEPEHDTSGGMAIWATGGEGKTLTAVAGNPYMQNLIWSVHRTGGLNGPLRPEFLTREEVNEEPRPEAPNKGWVCVQQQLAPRGSETINMGMSWFYPNHRSIRGTRVGHAYANWFDSAADVAKFAIRNHDKLLERSRALPDRVMESTMPGKLKLSLLDQLSTLTKSTHFIENGRFGLQEGHGCCAFNCMDVDHYSSYALSHLFPALREKALDMAKEWQDPVSGRAFHGYPGTVEVPEKYEEQWHRHDCSCQYVLQLYRDAKISGNVEMLERHWDGAKAAIGAINRMDDYGVGLPRIDGGITYDHWHLHGIVSYMAGVYLAALLAIEDMAEFLGDEAEAADARRRIRDGAASFEELLWNGERYVLFYAREDEGEAKPCCDEGCGCRPDEFMEVRDTGVMTDALNGNGTAAVMGLGTFLDGKRYRDYLRLVLQENWRTDVNACVNGSYPEAEQLDEWPFQNEWPFAQWHTPWTGTEHFLVSQLYVAGLEKEAERVIDGVFDRHVREGMRFDHTECNNHYARPLSIWSVPMALLGLEYDGWRAECTIDPRTASREYGGLLLTGTCMGRLDYAELKTRTKASIALDSGRMPLKRLALGASFKARRADVTLGGKPVESTVESVDGRGVITFKRKLAVTPAKELGVVLS